MQPSQEKMENSASGLGGIVNMGLTCYANAVIQVLRQIPRFRWILEKDRFDTLFSRGDSVKPRREAQQSFTTSFAEIVQMLWKCERGQSVRPGEFWKRVPPLVEDTMYEHLASKAPHDSHEFFLFLLESIHEATAQEVDMRIVRPPPVTPQDHLVHGALAAWQREFSKEYSPFVDLFFGLVHWQTVCQACGNVSHRWESFNSLKIPVPAGGLGQDPPTLESMLQEEMAPETIEGYQCDKCPQRTEAKRFMRVWRLPQTLILVIKRFTPDGRKIHTRIAPLVPSEGSPRLAIAFTPYFSQDSPERNGATHYTLRGIVDHHGSSRGGHYTAQCRHAQADIWHMYDDEGVGEITSGQPHFGDSTYMLFFERA
jgi:ubiquitin C-terminal hydrolase